MKTFLEIVLIPLVGSLVVLLFNPNVKIWWVWKFTAGVGLAVVALALASFAERLTTESTHPITGRRRQTLAIAIVVLLVAVGYLSGYLGVSQPVDEGKSALPGPEAVPVVTIPNLAEPEAMQASEKGRPDGAKLTGSPHDPGEESFAQKYLAKDSSPDGGAPRWAILIAGSDPMSYPELNSAAAGALSEKGYQRVSIFRPSLVQDGKHKEVYAADPLLMRTLSEYCDGVIVATVDSALRKETSVEGLLAVELSAQVRVILPKSGAIKDEFSLHETGAGFSSAQAHKHAEARAATSLQTRLGMVLR